MVLTDCRRTPLMDCRLGRITLAAKLPAPMQPTLTSSPRRGRGATATAAKLLCGTAGAFLYSRIAVDRPLFRSANAFAPSSIADRFSGGGGTSIFPAAGLLRKASILGRSG